MAAILHLTDIHFSSDRHIALMSAMESEFFDDVRHVVTEMGHPISVVVFSGDLAFAASIDDYYYGLTFFEKLADALLDATGVVPPLFAVPGNHDYQRGVLASPFPLLIEKLWSDIAIDFWSADVGRVREQLAQGFGNYAEWWSSPGMPVLSRAQRGAFPGDHAATLELDNVTLGFLGLNTSVRHISDNANPGDLSVSAEQIASAVGGDIVKWSSSHDLCVLVTHHPIEWLDSESQQLLGELLFNPTNRFVFHLSGHLHEPNATVGERLSVMQYQRLQGRSLFGLETLRSGVSRSHGYQLLELTKDLSDFRLCPRSASRTAGGAWRLSVDSAFALPRGKQFTTWQPLGRTLEAKAKAKGPAQPPAPGDSKSDETDDHEETKRLLLRDVATGTVCLVLGDDLRAFGTAPIAGVPLLGTELRRLVLGEAVDLDDTGRIADLYRLAVRSQARETRQAVSNAAGDGSDDWRDSRNALLGGPWPFVVDLWIGPDDDVLTSNAVRREQVKATDEVRLDDGFYHLKVNGVASDHGSIAFHSPSSDPERSHRRSWLRRLSHELVRRPVLYLSNSVETLGLWEYIELRGTDASRLATVPWGYLVCPSLTPTQAATLSLYKVRWIRANAQEFVSNVLRPSQAEWSEGSDQLRRLDGSDLESRLPFLVRDIRRSGVRGANDVLLGREPEWADVLGDFTIRLSSVDAILNELEKSRFRVLLVHGTAGSGKTAALMRAALELDADGHTVAWIDRTLTLSLREVREFVVTVQPEFLFVDNVDIYGVFGSQAAEEITRLSANTRVVAAVRTHQLERLTPILGGSKLLLPDLSNADAWDLLEKLETEGLLGGRRRMARADRFELLTNAGRRQLLVGLMQATRGELFDRIIESEFDQLSDPEQLAYGLASIVASLNEEGISENELEMAGGAYGSAARQVTVSLLKSKILILHPARLLAPRHRVIGERVLGVLQRRGELSSLIQSLVTVLAVSAKHTQDPARRDRRLLIRLINHDQVARFGLDLDEVRTMYAAAQADLYDDFHFWLQRGTYELERGDLRYALNYLEQARTIEGGHDDPYVLTEFSIARLRAARESSDPALSFGLGASAVADLERVIRTRGARSPHTVVALATSGLDWIENAGIGDDSRREYALRTSETLSLMKDVAMESEYASRSLAQASRRLGRLLSTQE